MFIWDGEKTYNFLISHRCLIIKVHKKHEKFRRFLRKFDWTANASLRKSMRGFSSSHSHVKFVARFSAAYTTSVVTEQVYIFSPTHSGRKPCVLSYHEHETQNSVWAIDFCLWYYFTHFCISFLFGKRSNYSTGIDLLSLLTIIC